MNQNSDFYNFQGTINRKNYVINLLILIALYILISFIRFDAIEPYIKYKFLYSTLIWIAGFFKFLITISALSVIYRRISDFSGNNTKMKTLFFIFYLYPVMFFYFGFYLLDILPVLMNILMYSLLIILPVSAVLMIIFAFLRSKEY